MVVVAAILYKLVVLEEEKTYAWKFSSSFIIYVGTWYDQYKYCVFLIIMDVYLKRIGITYHIWEYYLIQDKDFWKR